ncbi:MAG TPA: 16S rRNA (cytidine(1402)-2'-O)-methyltransferase [Gemmatimonadaceae bacterium]
MTSSVGRLYVVSTPIGNLGDLSARAVEVLRTVYAVLAEDTRHSRHLLEHYEIATSLTPYHEHNEARETPRILERLKAGESFALISDAGTPLLSDPGARLVRAAIDADIAVVPVPGASALLAALVASGLDADRFTFFGFLPRKGRERTEAFDAVLELAHTAVVYEAPGRVADTLAELERRGAGDREVVVARELTKQFEETRRGTVGELARYYADAPPRGEVVIVLAGRGPSSPDEEAARERARVLRQGGASARDVARALVEEHGLARNAAYRLAHEPE